MRPRRLSCPLSCPRVEIRLCRQKALGLATRRRRIFGRNRIRQKDTKGTQICVLLHPPWFPPIPNKSFGMYGGDDGARTRDLCRDSISYNSCRNRSCPKCQAQARERWLEARQQELLDTGYFHVVFTVPHELKPLKKNRPH